MKSKNSITIRDVASTAGVSISTVSRYLANPESVRAYMGYNIRNAIRDLNYQPNVFAQNLRRNTSNIIGVVTPNSNYYFGVSYKAISDFFYTKGYISYLCISDNDVEKERFFIQSLLNNKPAGLAIISSGKNKGFLSEISETFKRIVILDRPEEINCDTVVEDHEQNAYLLTSHILAKKLPGTPLIIMLGFDQATSTQRILAGMYQSFKESPVLPDYTVFHDCNRTDNLLRAVSHTKELVNNGKHPQIIAFGPNILEEAVLAFNKTGISVIKGHVLLAGFALPNTIDRLGFDFPCVIQNPEYSGIVAAELLHKRIIGEIKTSDAQFLRIESVLHLI